MLIRIQIFFLLLSTPFIGAFLAFAQDNPYTSMEKTELIEEHKEIEKQSESIKHSLFEKRELMTEALNISQASNVHLKNYKNILSSKSRLNHL